MRDFLDREKITAVQQKFDKRHQGKSRGLCTLWICCLFPPSRMSGLLLVCSNLSVNPPEDIIRGLCMGC